MTALDEEKNTRNMPQELEQAILRIVKTMPEIPSTTIRTIYEIANVAFHTGVNTGLDKALLRVEETHQKLQSLVN
jgi:hypothetical protein